MENNLRDLEQIPLKIREIMKSGTINMFPVIVRARFDRMYQYRFNAPSPFKRTPIMTIEELNKEYVFYLRRCGIFE